MPSDAPTGTPHPDHIGPVDIGPADVCLGVEATPITRTGKAAHTPDSTLVFATPGLPVVLPRTPADRRARPPMPPDRGIMVASAWPSVGVGGAGPGGAGRIDRHADPAARSRFVIASEGR